MRLSSTGRAAVLIAVAVIAAACSRGRAPGPVEPDGPVTPRRGGVLRLGVAPPTSLDPARARTVDEVLVADQLFDSLTAWDPVTLEPVPSLAARWQASPDQRQWDFFLRPGATFADGRPITSADVKYSLERVARKDSGSSVADLLEPITGFSAFNVEGSAGELAGVTAPSAEVVRIELDVPLSVLPSVLGNAALAIVPREAVEAQPPAAPFAEQPVGSGPFMVKARSQTSISLVPAAGATPLVAGIELVLFDTVDASYRAFSAGQLDWSQVPADHVGAAAQRHGSEGYRPYVAELFYGFNLANPKFADRRFREAIVRAVDRNAIVAGVYGGTVMASDAVVVQGVPGYQGGVCAEDCRYDPARSAALLAEVFAGVSPPAIQIDYDDQGTQPAVATAIQANLAAVGIPSELRPKPLEEYQKFAVSGDKELFRLGWIGAYPSPDAFLTPLFASGQPSNLTGLTLPEVDATLGAARAEASPDRRIELYRAAERTVLSQLPVLPIGQFRIHGVVAARVRDLVLSTAGTFDGSKVWLVSGD